MVKKKTKKKKVIQNVGAKLTPEQYAKLISKFKESSQREETKLFKEHLKKGTDKETYAIQEVAVKKRQKLIAQRLKSDLDRGEREAVRRQVAYAEKTPVQRAFSRVSPSVRKLDTKIGAVARKAIHLLAPRGFVKTITTPPSKKVSGRGRGRPKKSYKLRFVPGVGAVRVPTHIYNKMMAEVKAKRRLAEAQKQAEIQQRQATQYEAEQLAMTQDPRFQSSQEDAWADSDDMEHEQELMQEKQRMMMEGQRQQVPSRGVVQRAGDVMRSFGAGVNRLGQPRYPSAMPQQVSFQPSQPVRREPVVRAVSEKANLLSVGNIFNRPGGATIGFGR